MNNITFETGCSACEHRGVCKYKDKKPMAAILILLEKIAPDIPEPFIVKAKCKEYR